MAEEKKPKPNYYWSILAMTCPRCRRGPLFISKNAYSKLTMGNILNMPETCAECGQRFHLEPGFWYGTGYVSYALTIVFSAVSFILWWLIIGFSLDDYRLFYWLIANAVLLIVLQPWLMRLSRSVYLRFFITYDEEYEITQPKVYS
ncbi:MAG: DUF983 domain-containing protein [Chitinophagaceae bacterium]|nr:DUF983 domain-containing protein [Chitinophagaceae bacterium]MBL0254254.1 DUF983 domain-containing protein [Chitinophagaceae bacterium]